NANQHSDFIKAVDKVISVSDHDEIMQVVPEVIAGNIPILLKLMSSSRDRVILQFLLCCCFSNTKLHQLLGYTSSTANSIKTQVDSFLVQAELHETESQKHAEEHIVSTISRLEEIIEKRENLLERKRKRLAIEEEEDWDYDLKLKRQRVMNLKNRPPTIKKRIARRHFHSWKKSLKSQQGKNKGIYRIDRRAEKAIFKVLEEQLQAHKRRWGEEGTGYLESDGKRLHKRDMRRIANKFLDAHGKRLIKSNETARSWGRCRNKRSRQAKQHRGANFWSHMRTQKTFRQCHVNVHYNRAHIKNYTRLAFGNDTDCRDLVVRRAIDDKAYVRCE
ncbi:RNA-directed DNA polymerase from transposon X-element, partial [Paramuricea clavata]